MTLPPLSRKNFGLALDTLGKILVGAVRIFAWNSIREGFIDVRHLARVPRVLALVGLGLVFGFLLSTLFNDPLRLSGTLEPLPLSSSASRGIFVPSLVVPLALVAVIFAWTFILTSALHIHVLVRWAILLCFVFFGVPGNFVGTAMGATFEREVLLLFIIGITAIIFLLLITMFLVFPRLGLPVVLEFTLMLGCVGGLFVLILFTAVETTRASGINWVGGYFIPEAVTNARNLIVPLTYLSGAEIINFGIAFTSWSAQSTARFARAGIVTALLAVFLGYRWFDVLTRVVLPGISPSQWLAWTGAALAIVCLIPIAWWRLRQPLEDRIPFKLIVGLILVRVVPQQLLFLAVILVSAFFLTQTSNPNVILEMEAANRPFVEASNFLGDAAFFVIALTGVIVAVLAVRSKRYSVAAFGMILAWTQFVRGLTEHGRPLQALAYKYSDIELWILIGLTVLTIYWVVRRELNSDRALKLLALGFFAWVLHLTDFLDNPLPYLFGLAGVSATAFGILWGVLTAGGRWGVNSDSPQFPKMSRVLLAIGYVLLTVNISHWFLVTHDVQERTFSDVITQAGLRIFGYTLAFLVFVEGGRALLKKSD